jgi:hypothetical protein
MNRLPVAASDIACVNPASSFATEIQIEHAVGHLGTRLKLGNDADHRTKREQAVDFAVRAAANAVRGPA